MRRIAMMTEKSIAREQTRRRVLNRAVLALVLAFVILVPEVRGQVCAINAAGNRLRE